MAEMSMLEKVTRAIHAKRRRPDDNKHWFHENPERCELSRQLARAAIEAMREPTEKQLDAVRYLVQWHTFERPTEAALLRHAGCLRRPAPEGCRDVEHVPPTNMVSYWIHRGIIDAALSEHAEINTAGSATNSKDADHG